MISIHASSSCIGLLLKQKRSQYVMWYEHFSVLLRLPHAMLVRLPTMRMDADSPLCLIFFLTYVHRWKIGSRVSIT